MTAWKDLERRVCRALGAERRPSVGGSGWARGSDDDGTAPFSVECKRTTRYGLRRSWIEQARRNARADGRPWLLVIAEHGDHRPIAVVDFWTFAQLVEEAGRLGSAAERRADNSLRGGLGTPPAVVYLPAARARGTIATANQGGVMTDADPTVRQPDETPGTELPADTDPDPDRDTDSDEGSSEDTDDDESSSTAG